MTISRRKLLVGVVLTAATACGGRHRERQGDQPPTPSLSDSAEPLPTIEEHIGLLEKRYNAFVGFYGANLNANGPDRTLSHRDGDRFAMCSTFKAYLAARVLQKAQLAELRVTDTLLVDPVVVVGYSPITQPKVGSSLSLNVLCQAVLQHSDNTAANMLLRVIGGPPAITEFARSIGDDQTRLDRWETELNSAIPGDPRDTSTPRALGGGIRTLLTGSVLDEPHRVQLENWMRGNVTSEHSMRAGLPPGWTTADKTGTGDFASTNDIGIAFGPNGERLLLSVMTRTRSDDSQAEPLRPLIAEVTRLALPWLLGKS